MTKKLLLGDEAIALGAIHAGLSGVYAYPGTPSTEITEFIQGNALAKFNHSIVESCVYFFSSPTETSAILAHFKTRNANAACVNSL